MVLVAKPSFMACDDGVAISIRADAERVPPLAVAPDRDSAFHRAMVPIEKAAGQTGWPRKSQCLQSLVPFPIYAAEHLFNLSATGRLTSHIRVSAGAARETTRSGASSAKQRRSTK